MAEIKLGAGRGWRALHGAKKCERERILKRAVDKGTNRGWEGVGVKETGRAFRLGAIVVVARRERPATMPAIGRRSTKPLNDPARPARPLYFNLGNPAYQFQTLNYPIFATLASPSGRSIGRPAQMDGLPVPTPPCTRVHRPRTACILGGRRRRVYSGKR